MIENNKQKFNEISTFLFKAVCNTVSTVSAKTKVKAFRTV